MWCSRHGKVSLPLSLSLLLFFLFTHYIIFICLAVMQQKWRRWRWSVAGPGAATQDMGAASHSRSCLVLQPVERLRYPHQRQPSLGECSAGPTGGIILVSFAASRTTSWWFVRFSIKTFEMYLIGVNECRINLTIYVLYITYIILYILDMDRYFGQYSGIGISR